MRAFSAVAVAAALSVFAFACGGDGPTANDDSGNGGNDATGGSGGIGGGGGSAFVTVTGTVYANSNGTSFSNPIANAQVSTSLDGTMVTTDSNGRFTLVTATPVPSRCTEYAVIITAYAYTPYRVTGNWGSHAGAKSFSLFPQVPTQVATC